MGDSDGYSTGAATGYYHYTGICSVGVARVAWVEWGPSREAVPGIKRVANPAGRYPTAMNVPVLSGTIGSASVCDLGMVGGAE